MKPKSKRNYFRSDGKAGFFGLESHSDLYCKAKHDLEVFSQNPNDHSLFNLVCILNHLREWIEKNQGCRHEKKLLRSKLINNPDYKIIQQLCNNAKHFYDNGIGLRSKSFNGFTCGFSGAGDSLGQRNYIIDGQDIRNIISRVFNKYREYFEKNESM